METLIFIGIAVVVAIIQNMANKSKEEQKPLPAKGVIHSRLNRKATSRRVPCKI